MINDNKMYCLMLEDYSYPRYSNVTRPYVGTRSEIDQFIRNLKENSCAAKRYAATIDAVEKYGKDKNTSHCIAGQEFKILTPVKEIYRREFTLDEHEWTYKASSDCRFGMWANHISISQILISNENGILRCSKATYEGLQIAIHGVGWIYVEDNMKGFPGIYSYKNNINEMSLYIGQQHYALGDRNKAQAIRDLGYMYSADLTDVTRDIVGEG